MQPRRSGQVSSQPPLAVRRGGAGSNDGFAKDGPGRPVPPRLDRRPAEATGNRCKSAATGNSRDEVRTAGSEELTPGGHSPLRQRDVATGRKGRRCVVHVRHGGGRACPGRRRRRGVEERFKAPPQRLVRVRSTPRTCRDSCHGPAKPVGHPPRAPVNGQSGQQVHPAGSRQLGARRHHRFGRWRRQ